MVTKPQWQLARITDGDGSCAIGALVWVQATEPQSRGSTLLGWAQDPTYETNVLKNNERILIYADSVELLPYFESNVPDEIYSRPWAGTVYVPGGGVL